jgi:hypothetical protein
MHGMLDWLSNNWPLVGTLVAGTGVLIMWTKKQVLDNVFATKKEVHALEDHIDKRLDASEKAGMERHLSFQKEISANHSELKTLIIHHLDKK